MNKDFERWHSEKEIIDKKNIRVFFDEREIWTCAIGINIGFEQEGKGNNFLRPVLIFKKFGNELFWGIPLTRTQKMGKHYFTISEQPRSVAILSQIRALDAKRLRYRVEIVNIEVFKALRTAFLELVSL